MIVSDFKICRKKKNKNCKVTHNKIFLNTKKNISNNCMQNIMITQHTCMPKNCPIEQLKAEKIFGKQANIYPHISFVTK